MAWLQVHQTLKDHRKLFDAADQLEVEPPHMGDVIVAEGVGLLREGTPIRIKGQAAAETAAPATDEAAAQSQTEKEE